MNSQPHKARYSLWKDAFENAEFALATAEKLYQRHSRVFKKHAPNNSVKMDIADPSDDDDSLELVDAKFVNATEVEGTRVDNLNVGGLGHEECLFICSALREKACIEFMTVFGPMGAGGNDVAANDETGVKAVRDKLISDIAAELDLAEADIRGTIDQVKAVRNEMIAHRSGSGVADVVICELSTPGGTASVITYTDVHRRISFGRLHDICKAACELTPLLVFPSQA